MARTPRKPEDVANLRELAGDGPPQAKGKKSIINTATRGDEDKQRIATPWAFIHALEQRFGTPVDFDLAADKDNTKAPDFFDVGIDALADENPWQPLYCVRNAGFHESENLVKLAYLNPPFTHIKPWASKLANCRWLKRWTVMLVPASYSTDWFLELKGKVLLDAIPRIQFEGNTHLYPKDLVLCIAGFGITGMGYWDWRISYLQWCQERNQPLDPAHTKGLTKWIARIYADNVFPDFDWTPSPFTL